MGTRAISSRFLVILAFLLTILMAPTSSKRERPKRPGPTRDDSMAELERMQRELEKLEREGVTINPPAPSTPPAGCPRNTYTCDTKECILPKYVCDGDRDCSDGSDEKNCGPAPPDAPKSPRSKGGRKSSSRRSSSQDDDDDDDEKIDLENFVCPGNLFTCNNKECVHGHSRCDGEEHCSDGSDEWDCEAYKKRHKGAPGAPKCPPNLYQCRSGECILPKYRCDGSRECHDGSDEKDCGRQERKQRIKERKADKGKEGKIIECPDHMFRCNNGACVRKDARCDQKKQCLDGSDEWGCHRKQNQGKGKSKTTKKRERKDEL